MMLASQTCGSTPNDVTKLSFYRAANAVWIKPWFGDLN